MIGHNQANIETLPALKYDCAISIESFLTVHYQTTGITQDRSSDVLSMLRRGKPSFKEL